MNKVMNIAVAIAISTFLAVNFYLLFSDKSVITKSVYVERYERMTSSDQQQELAKEGLIAPEETYTIYVGNDDTVDSWLVKEGDLVTVGDEIAILQTERADGQRAVWEAELDALHQQTSAVQSMIAGLESEREKAKSDSSSNVNRKDGVSKNEDSDVEVGLNVDVQVDVKQDGSFAQAIAAAEQDLAEVERQLTVVEAQLAQDPGRPALVSPVDGVVSKVTRTGSQLSVDIFSSQKVIVTYAKNDEWQQIESGDVVLIQGDGIENAVEGTVLSVSQAPASNGNSWLNAYKALDDDTVKNPLSYYEVRILTDTAVQSVPYGTNVNAVVIVNEAQDAISVKEKWLHDLYKENAYVWKIDDTGRATKVDVATPFTWKKRAVVTQGLQLGDVVVYEPALQTYAYAPRVLMSIPTEFPSKAQWRAFGWRNYVKYIFIR
ncbi:efflux RND transporter periplasmic adaptor subunit [Sporosarcina sp. FSL K6-1508]|uniref:efflux RND transporter periplasmic adaptor subunit n=1 Tax=Sporosarcina sp. FSL K6-1508 TaxID=2921553 RepID=UPI0030FA14CB